ncbi:2-oxoglutarate dehydrogenase E1 subunit family protein, partial [Streptomyces caniscabiei]|uniref:2-oxoglutarate dehydrogenase E1 subunit family protein n=1 Tax=Streptomyces caniscabiei TaxID=2746961 RepID=UPI003AF67B1A
MRSSRGPGAHPRRPHPTHARRPPPTPVPDRNHACFPPFPPPKHAFRCDLRDEERARPDLPGHGGVAFIPAVHHLVKRKRAVAAVSPQSPSNSSISTDADQAGKNPAAAFGPNEWLVDEIYQQYLQDPNSVDRAWWDFFADYKPGAAAAPAPASSAATGAAATTTPAAPAAPAQAPPPPPAPPPPAPPPPPPPPPPPRSPC